MCLRESKLRSSAYFSMIVSNTLLCAASPTMPIYDVSNLWIFSADFWYFLQNFVRPKVVSESAAITALRDFLTTTTEDISALSLIKATNNVLPMGLLTEPGQVDLAFTAVSNKTYLIQFRDSLTSGAWQTLIDVP